MFLFLFSCCDTTINLIGICDDLLTFCRRLCHDVCHFTQQNYHWNANICVRCVCVVALFSPENWQTTRFVRIHALFFFALIHAHTQLLFGCVWVCACGKRLINGLINFRVYWIWFDKKSDKANRTIENNCTQIQSENKWLISVKAKLCFYQIGKSSRVKKRFSWWIVFKSKSHMSYRWILGFFSARSKRAREKKTQRPNLTIDRAKL